MAKLPSLGEHETHEKVSSGAHRMWGALTAGRIRPRALKGVVLYLTANQNSVAPVGLLGVGAATQLKKYRSCKNSTASTRNGRRILHPGARWKGERGEGKRGREGERREERRDTTPWHDPEGRLHLKCNAFASPIQCRYIAGGFPSQKSKFVDSDWR